MTSIEIDKVPRIVSEWLRIGYPDSEPTPADADHSALLQRLLRGQKIYDQPPPRAFSYPWYELLDNGRAEGYFDIGIWPEGVPVYTDNKPSVTICQSRWLLEQKQDDGSYIVVWETTGLRARLEVPQQAPEGCDYHWEPGRSGVLTVLDQTPSRGRA